MMAGNRLRERGGKSREGGQDMGKQGQGRQGGQGMRDGRERRVRGAMHRLGTAVASQWHRMDQSMTGGTLPQAAHRKVGRGKGGVLRERQQGPERRSPEHVLTGLPAVGWLGGGGPPWRPNPAGPWEQVRSSREARCCHHRRAGIGEGGRSLRGGLSAQQGGGRAAVVVRPMPGVLLNCAIQCHG